MSLVSHVCLMVDPRGRVNRKALLWVAIALLSIQALAVAAAMLVSSPVLHFLLAVVKLASLWIATAAAIKRLHDLGLSGWWVPGGILIQFVWTLVACFASFLVFGEAIANIGSGEFIVYAVAVMALPLAVTVWLHFAPGTVGPNKYGPEPDESGLSMPEPASRGSVMAVAAT